MNNVSKYITGDGAYYVQSVRLLTAKDCKPIKLGDTVWGEDGKKWRIDAIGEKYVWGRGQHPTQKRLKPEWLTHTEPDSWERIERDAYAADNAPCGLVDGELVTAIGLVRRCEALAAQR